MLYCTKATKYINCSNLLPHSSVFCRKPALQPVVSQTKTELVRVQSAQLVGHALLKTNIEQVEKTSKHRFLMEMEMKRSSKAERTTASSVIDWFISRITLISIALQHTITIVGTADTLVRTNSISRVVIYKYITSTDLRFES